MQSFLNKLKVLKELPRTRMLRKVVNDSSSSSKIQLLCSIQYLQCVKWLLKSLAEISFLVAVRDTFAGLFIKPGIQEWGTECREREECSLRFRGMFSF